MSEGDRNEPEGEEDVTNPPPGGEKGEGHLKPVGEEDGSHGRTETTGNLEEPPGNNMDRGDPGSNTESQIATEVSSGQSQPVGQQSTGGKDSDQEYHSSDEDSKSSSKSTSPNTQQVKKHKTLPETFPDSLEGFGYYFNEGEMVLRCVCVCVCVCVCARACMRACVCALCLCYFQLKM